MKNPMIKLDEKLKEVVSKQIPLFRKLIVDLEELVLQYNNESSNLFGVCIMSDTDLDKWQKMNPYTDKNLYFKKMNRFWSLNIAITYGGLLIPHEELISAFLKIE